MNSDETVPDFLSLEDRHCTFEVTLFPRVWRQIEHLIGDGGVFVGEGGGLSDPRLKSDHWGSSS